MTNLQTLDLSALSSIHGGVPSAPGHHVASPPPRPAPHPAPPMNRTDVRTNAGVFVGPIRVGVEVQVHEQRTDRAQCLETAARMHATPEQAGRLCPA